MFRKLILLALAAAGVAAFLRSRGSSSTADEVSPTPADTRAEQAATAPPDDEAVAPESAGEPSDAVVVPDTSADDPLVRQAEKAAAAEAASIGGPADTVTADADPEMRPVVEGSGDSEETFEATEDEGR